MTKSEFFAKFAAEYIDDRKDPAKLLSASEKAWADSGAKADKKRASTDDFLNFLAEAKRSEEEVSDWIDSEGSDNTRKNRKHWEKIGELTRRIWDTKADAKPAKAA